MLGKFLDLKTGNVSYLGPIDLAQYFVKEVTIEPHVVPPSLGAVKVDIVFKRRILATFLRTYLPTLLLCLVCFTTNYFKPFFFEATVTVNLTSLLVLTTLFISVSNSLPTTSYIKMMDLWLIFTQFIPFMEVIIHTFIDGFRVRDEEGRLVNQHGSVRLVKEDPHAMTKISPESVSAWKKSTNYHEKMEKVAIKTARVGMPAFFCLFTIIYFIVGLSR